MTRDEAVQILAQMATAWPTYDASDDHLRDIWLRRLTDHDHEHARATIDRLVDTTKWWPAWSDYLAAYRSRVRTAPGAPALPRGGTLTPEENAAKIKALRAGLRPSSPAGSSS